MAEKPRGQKSPACFDRRDDQRHFRGLNYTASLGQAVFHDVSLPRPRYIKFNAAGGGGDTWLCFRSTTGLIAPQKRKTSNLITSLLKRLVVALYGWLEGSMVVGIHSHLTATQR